MNQNFVDFMRGYMDAPLAVAVSGGVDSVTLLCWLVRLGAHVTALHVNHDLRPTAGVEAAYVTRLCASLGVPCHVFHWAGPKPHSGLEAAARTARYRFMTDWCRANGVRYLLTAHQADDQIETFLLNLARGSGISGLAAMRGVSYRDGITILRPLLSVPRTELVAYCDNNGIKYYHDEMNDDMRYARVRMRKNRHVLQDALGISDARISLAVRNLGRIRDALECDVASLVSRTLCDNRAVFTDSFLFDLTPDIRLKFIAALIMQIGGGEYQPRLKSLEGALNTLTHDCKFTLGHCTIRRLGERILIVPEGTRTSFRKRHEKTKKE